MKPLLSYTLLFTAAALIAAADDVAAPSKAGRTPVLIELFTSEGCSSCPPADKLLEVLDRTQPVSGADIIVLSEHVDYWDRLGWKDPFSSPAFTERQREYSTQFKNDNIYTPQLVVDGSRELVGSDKSGAISAIEKSASQPKLPVTLSTPVRQGDRLSVRVDLQPSTAQTSLFVALAENQAQSNVSRGENSGRTLNHVGVVRKLMEVGPTSANSAFSKDVELPLANGVGTHGLRVIAFLVDRRSGHVLGVAQQKL